MKKIFKKLFALLIILTAGWFIGYLKIPYVETSNEFWFGFSACIVCFGILYLIVRFRNNNRALKSSMKGIQQNEPNDQSLTTRWRNSLWYTSLLVFIGCLLVSSIFIYQTIKIEKATGAMDRRLTELQEVSDALNKKHKIDLMANVLNLVDEDMKTNPQGPLRNSTIARIVAYSHSLKPYKYFVNDTLTDHLLSPERGQLLIALTLMDIDSNSFARIKSDADFTYSDLRNAKLDSVDFTYINLENCDLSYASLEGANFSFSKLRNAQMEGAKLNNARLNDANLRGTNMSWIQMVNAEMINSDATGANLSYGQFQNSNLSKSRFDFANICNAVINNCVLIETDFARSYLFNANIIHCDLTNGRLTKSQTNQLNLQNTALNNVEVTEKWFNDNSLIIDIDSIENKYTISKLGNLSGSNRYYLSLKN